MREFNLGIVLCVGENLEEREDEQTYQVLSEQLTVAAEPLKGNWSDVVIAYEPIWAIGTGKIASADQTQETHEMIRKWIKDNVGPKVAEETRIVYGGSVTETNCDNIIKLHDVDGFLMGTSSIKPSFRTVFE